MSSASFAEALRVGQQKFNETFLLTEELELELSGAALKRFLVIKMVAVGVYFPPKTTADQVLTDIPKRIQIAYIQNISKRDLIKEADKGFRSNIDKQTYERIKEQIDQLYSYYTDVELDDRYTLTYVPGEGTMVEFNDVEQGLIEGPDFAYAFFSMYIGAKPLDKKNKLTLLYSLRENEK